MNIIPSLCLKKTENFLSLNGRKIIFNLTASQMVSQACARRLFTKVLKPVYASDQTNVHFFIRLNDDSFLIRSDYETFKENFLELYPGFSYWDLLTPENQYLNLHKNMILLTNISPIIALPPRLLIMLNKRVRIYCMKKSHH